MTDDEALQRRVEEALQRRGGGAVGKFDAHLHPHDRVGKFRETFAPEPRGDLTRGQSDTAINARMAAYHRTGRMPPPVRAPAERPASDPDALTRALHGQLAAQGRTTAPTPGGRETAAQAPHDPIRDRRADGGLRSPADVPDTSLIGSPGRSSAGRLRNFRAMSDTKLAAVVAQLERYDDPAALAAARAEAGTRSGMREATFSEGDRKKLADKGAAMPDGSFPIRNARDLGNAVQALGRAKDKAKAKAHIIARAKALKLISRLPDDWHIEEADMTAEERAAAMDRRVELRLIAMIAEAHDKGAEPFSASKTSNWVARGGGLPHYIQHIAHDLMEKRGKSESQAIQMAIGIVRRWASGEGNVKPDVRAAAAKAIAEWEALKAKAKARKAA